MTAEGGAVAALEVFSSRALAVVVAVAGAAAGVATTAGLHSRRGRLASTFAMNPLADGAAERRIVMRERCNSYKVVGLMA